MAASAASSSGSSSRLVTCAWLLGVRRARSLVIASVSSAGRSSGDHAGELGRASCRPTSRTTSARGTPGSTNRRANATSSSAIASSATVEVDAVRGDEGVERVELGGRPAVQLDDAAVRVDDERRLGIVRAASANRPSAASSSGEAVEVDRLLVQACEAAQAQGSSPSHGRSSCRRRLHAPDTSEWARGAPSGVVP